MNDRISIPDLIAKHLPPSAGPARVQTLDASAQAWVDALHAAGSAVECDASDCDACVASELASIGRVTLRAGGRALFLLKNETRPLSALSASLEQAGLIHILVEALSDDWVLARGERPPRAANPATRLARVAALGDELTLLSGEELPRFVHLLVHQEPDARGWEQSDLALLTWDALTLRDTSTSQTVLLGFSSLTKAVAFMQAAVLAAALVGINKLPRFRGDTIAGWHVTLLLNPAFETLKTTARFDFASLPLRIDPRLEDKLRE